MPQASDEELMAQVRQRNQEAFTRLLDRHAAGLHAFLNRMIRNRSDAEDLTQEAFLRVWQHAVRFEPGRVKFSTWLYRIGHNLCVDRLRKHREVSIETVQEATTAVADTPNLDRERTNAKVRTFIGELPERQRTALVLCHYQGMSNQAAAEVLDVTVDALESLLSRARRTLRERMTPFVAGRDDAADTGETR